MQLIKIEREDLPKPKYPGRPYNSAYRSTIEDFLASGMDAALVDGFDRPVKSLCNAFRVQNKRMGHPVHVTFRSGKVYLLRKDGDDLSESR